LRSSTLTKHPIISRTDRVIFTLVSFTGVVLFAKTGTSSGKMHNIIFITKYESTLDIRRKSKNSK
jgi:hypothetical protein